MATLDIKTGEIEKWADKMERRGADFAAEVVKKVKGGHERNRKRGRIKFAKIRRQKTGKRFVAAKKQDAPQAELIAERTSSKFKDIFKGK